ncbi:MAG: DUF427 domain-containing protein [Prochlorothrix sp.]|nr:DUF427 domain-containing protein [Prochlorothrix sp.]
MAKATFNGVVIAETDQYESVEGNVYFPPSAIKAEYFKPSDYHTTCGWKGVASYYHIEVNGETIANGAWYYPQAKERAKNIENYVAFWKGKGVTIEA